MANKLTAAFSRDPAAALERATAQLTTTEGEIAALQAERAAAVRDYEDVEAVAAVDAKIDHKRRTAGILRDRITALQEAQREHDRRKLDDARQSAVKTIVTRLDARVQAATKLDRAGVLVAEALAELAAADEAVFAGWSDLLPPAHRLTYLRMLNLDPISSQRKPRPMSPGVIRQLVEKLPLNLAGEAEKRNAELVSELQAAPIPDQHEHAA